MFKWLGCLIRFLVFLAAIVLAVVAYCHFTPAEEFFIARRLMDVRQYAEAARWFEKGLERHPDHRMCGNARFDLGECYHKMGKDEDAISLLQEAIEHDRGNPRAPTAQMTIGKSLMAAGKDDEAAKAFARIRERYPEKTELAAEAEYLVAGIYLEKGDLPAAAKRARLVVSEYPTNPFAPRCQLMVGDILSQKEAWDRAVPAYQKVVDDYPATKEATEAQFRIAKIHYEQKSYKESLGALTKALSLAKDAHLLNTKLVRDIKNLVTVATGMLRDGGSSEAGAE